MGDEPFWSCGFSIFQPFGVLWSLLLLLCAHRKSWQRGNFASASYDVKICQEHDITSFAGCVLLITMLLQFLWWFQIGTCWNYLRKNLPHLDTRSLHLLISTYTYIILHISTYLTYLYFIHCFLYVYSRLYIHTYIYIYVQTYIYIYIYIYICSSINRYKSLRAQALSWGNGRLWPSLQHVCECIPKHSLPKDLQHFGLCGQSASKMC